MTRLESVLFLSNLWVGPLPAGGPVVPSPSIWNMCPPLHVWPPGCCIHPIQYFKNVSPLLVFGPSIWILAPLLLNPGDGPVSKPLIDKPNSFIHKEASIFCFSDDQDWRKFFFWPSSGVMVLLKDQVPLTCKEVDLRLCFSLKGQKQGSIHHFESRSTIYSYLAQWLGCRYGFMRDAWAGNVLFEKAVLGKPCTLEKNFLHIKCSADRLVSDELNQRKIPPCLDWYIGWKLGWIYCFFYLEGSLRSFKAVQNLQTYGVCC